VDSSLAAFFAISIAVIVTPGQDTALTIRSTAAATQFAHRCGHVALAHRLENVRLDSSAFVE